MRLFAIASLLSLAAFAADPATASFKARYQTQKLNFVETAEAMPSEHMAFRLTPEQRPFADWIEHTAEMNYRMCSQIAGKQPPADPGVKGVQTRGKDAIVTAIRDSFAYCDSAFASLTDEAAMREVPAGNRSVAPIDVMFSYIANLNAHYGNLVGYLRVKGVVPPSTARAARAKKK